LIRLLKDLRSWSLSPKTYTASSSVLLMILMYVLWLLWYTFADLLIFFYNIDLRKVCIREFRKIGELCSDLA
jgi:hypothetical protein